MNASFLYLQSLFFHVSESGRWFRNNTVRWGQLLLMAGALAAAAPATAETVVVINEIDADQTGTDTAEFIELYAYDSETKQAVANFSLNGYAVVLFNGANDTSYAVSLGGNRVFSINLEGYSTDASGLFLIKTAGMSGNGLEIEVASAGWLQQGADAVALYKNPTTDFSAATPVTATDLVDALVYGINNPDDAGLLDVLTPGRPQVNESGTGSSTTVAIARVPDGGEPFDTTTYALQAPTPGTLNQPAATLAVTAAPTSFAENAGAAASTGMITRTGPTTEAVTVALVSSDIGEATVPATVEIPAGAASATFPIAAVDDAWADGPQPVTITATAANFITGMAEVTVTDDGDPTQALVINEVYVTGQEDANGDGESGTPAAPQPFYNDEFVEIVNTSAAAVDLTGYTLWHSASFTARHTFPAGTVLAPGAAVVVFGGGLPALGITETFGFAWAQTANASGGGLFLVDQGGIVSLKNDAGEEIAGVTYTTQIIDGIYLADSLTRSPDLTGALARHAEASLGVADYSPGTRIDGTPFVTVTTALTVAASPTSFAENAGGNAATLIITRPEPFTEALVVSLSSSDPGEAVPGAFSTTIPAGEASVTVPITAVDDIAVDGTQTVTFTAIGAGFLNGTTMVEVTDDGLDQPPAAVYINEIDSDQPGADTGELIELYVGEPTVRSLEGYIVVLFNGANSQSYSVIDLAGRATDARGLFVIGNAGVANVDLVIPDNSFQNGPDAVAVYQSAAGDFPTGTAPTSEALVDVVVYGTDDTNPLLFAFTEEPLTIYSEGSANNTNALARVPDATTPFGVFVRQAPTPGASNATAPPTGGYAEWTEAYPGLGAREADDDGDGLSNLAEYALGSDPTKPGIPYTLALNASGKPVLTLPKGALAAADTRLTYTVEASTSLAAESWSAADTVVETNSATELIVAYNGASPVAFLRLRVTLAP